MQGNPHSFSLFVHNLLINDLHNCTYSSCMTKSKLIPYYANCAFCDAQFDVIGRMETFKKDVQYILKKANIGWKVRDLDEILKNAKINDRVDQDLVTHYFKQLDHKTRKKLYDIYKPDFELFGYDGEKFVSF